MEWIFLILFFVVQILLYLFRNALKKDFDKNGPTWSDPDFKELYSLLGKARTHSLMTQMKHRYPNRPKNWAIQKLIEDIRSGKIKR